MLDSNVVLHSLFARGHKHLTAELLLDPPLQSFDGADPIRHETDHTRRSSVVPLPRRLLSKGFEYVFQASLLLSNVATVLGVEVMSRMQRNGMQAVPSLVEGMGFGRNGRRPNLIGQLHAMLEQHAVQKVRPKAVQLPIEGPTPVGV